MSIDAESEIRVNGPGDLVWGAAAIGQVIGKSQRKTFYLLEAGRLTSAKKVGNQYVASRTALLKELGGVAS